jgi:two-component system, response regulator PdtaR
MLFRRSPRTIKRLLVVEDEPLVAFDTEYFLEQEGYAVVATVDNAEDAVGYLSRDRVDAVLLDVHLSGENSGIEVARTARERNVPVLFLTGNIPADAGSLAMAAVAKPYGHRDLMAALKVMEALIAGRKLPPFPGSVHVFA